MTADARATRSAAAVAAREGEWVMLTWPGLGAIGSCRCVIMRRPEPILSGGQITIDEDHYEGYVPAADVTRSPEAGGTITTAAAGTLYRIDNPPRLVRGLWNLTLRLIS